MTRSGQGHHDTGDQLNLNICELLAGVDRAAKIINDILLMPRTLTNAYRDRALLLQAAIAKNFHFSCEKVLIFLRPLFWVSPCLQLLQGM